MYDIVVWGIFCILENPPRFWDKKRFSDGWPYGILMTVFVGRNGGSEKVVRGSVALFLWNLGGMLCWEARGYRQIDP